MTKTETNFLIDFWFWLRRTSMRLVFKVLLQALFRIKITGKENVPKSGAYIVAYNHVSELEPPLILTFWPGLLEALAGHDVWGRGWQGWIVAGYGAIPVKRGEYDRHTLEVMLAKLRQGKGLMIAPEGGRSRKIGMRRANSGVAYLIEKVPVPVVPVAILGTTDNALKRAFKGARDEIIIQIGEPFTVPEITGKGAERREMRQKNADFIMLKIAQMLPEVYHGVYAGQSPE